jgi:hypothetical protein
MFLYNRATMLIIALPLHPLNPELQEKQANPSSRNQTQTKLTHETLGQRFSYWLSPNAQAVTLSGQAHASGLPKNAGEIVAVIPWQVVSWHTVKCPPVPKAKLFSALISLLEDQLLDEISHLHLILPNNLRSTLPTSSLGTKPPGLGTHFNKFPQSVEITIGACSKDWLRKSIDSLSIQSQSSVRVQRIVCELSPSLRNDSTVRATDPTPTIPKRQRNFLGHPSYSDLPVNGPSSSDMTTNQEAQISSSLASDISLTAPELHIFGPNSSAPQVVLCTSSGVQKLPPDSSSWGAFQALGDPRLLIFAEPHWVQITIETLGREPSVQTAAQRMLQSTQTPWDAATGEWAQSKTLQILRWVQRTYITFRHDKKWSLSRKGLVITLLINLIGLNALSWLEHSNLKSRETQLIQQLKQTFPELGYIVDPSVQMQSELKKIKHAKGQSAPGDLEAMLGALAKVLPKTFKLQNFDYSNEELRINMASLDTINDAGKKTLEQLGYNLREDKVVYKGQTVPVLIITYR